MKVWFGGEFKNIEIGQKVFVGHAGSGHSCFGEYGKLERTTVKHLVFRTESGAIIKTAIGNLHQVVGKAGKQGNFVSLLIEREFIYSPLKIY
ncbi:MAG: hypothetical protein Q4D26_07815 [Clostridia bacterium]|nr:hypothetical protein [Clostridia bacterium]